MKRILILIVTIFLLCILPILLNAQQNTLNSPDTICLPTARVARIADTISYLRKFQRYAIISDSALFECRAWGESLRQQNESLVIQRDIAVKSGQELSYQLGMQKSMSEEWQKYAKQADLQLQKIKKRRNVLAGILGGGAAAAIISTVVISALK